MHNKKITGESSLTTFKDKEVDMKNKIPWLLAWKTLVIEGGLIGVLILACIEKSYIPAFIAIILFSLYHDKKQNQPAPQPILLTQEEHSNIAGTYRILGIAEGRKFTGEYYFIVVAHIHELTDDTAHLIPIKKDILTRKTKKELKDPNYYNRLEIHQSNGWIEVNFLKRNV